MREEIRTILSTSENVSYGALTFSKQQVVITVAPGKKQSGSFTITGKEGLSLIGYIVANDIRMAMDRQTFEGSPVTVTYTFDACGLDVGSKIRGEFRIISTQGEYCLPYFASVVYQENESTLGQLKNLFHFANLAKTDWQEAMRFFYSSEFIRIMSGNDRQFRDFYRTMATMPIRDQKMEEFLIRIRKKSPIEYLLDSESVQLVSSTETMQETIVLTRNGWGYTHLDIHVEGDFISIEREELNEEDFVENKCRYPFWIHPEKIHGGKNFGAIRFFNEYVDIEVPICVSNQDTLYSVRRKKRKQKLQELVESYLSYAMEKISSQEWKERASELISGFSAPGEYNVMKELFEAQLMIGEERYNEAKWLLDRIGEENHEVWESPESGSYYLYLYSFCETDAGRARANLDKIRLAHRTNPTNWRIAWLLLYLDPDIIRSPQRKWMYLEQQFERNCHSPIWYLEAAQMVRKNPALLIRPTKFVLNTLNFMVKYDYLNEDIISQIHYLAGRIRKYSHRMYHILKKCYEIKEDTETLRAICEMLIGGGKIGAEYQHWYLRGIQVGLWIPKLYEHYIMSADTEDLDTRIPDTALRYFVYNNKMPAETKAFLYAYLIKNRDRYPEMFRIYYPEMEEFGKKQLEKKRISRNLAIIYNEVLNERDITEENADAFMEIGISHEIRIAKEGMKRVVLLYSHLKKEYVYTIQDGKAYVPIWGQNAEIVLEDGKGGRYSSEGIIEVEALLMNDVYWYDYADKLTLTPEQLCSLCNRSGVYTVLDEKNVGYAAKLYPMGEITESYRKELGMLLLHYYYEQDYLQEMDEILPTFSLEKLNDNDRAFVLRCMVMQGKVEEAFKGICRTGLERVEPRTLVRMCSRLLPYRGYAFDEKLIAVLYYSFCRGKYDESMLIYLQRNFFGTTEEMSSIFDACRRFEVDPYDVCEHLLIQMRMTGNYVHQEEQFFHRYREDGGKEAVLREYLVHCAQVYFAGRKKWTPDLFEILPEAFGISEEKNEIIELAMCKYLSEKDAVSETEKARIQSYIHDLVIVKQIYYGFFYKFRQICPEVELYHDRVVLEYTETDSSEKILHYMISRDGEKKKPYVTEALHSPRAGVYARNFILFFGESLHYYITEKRGSQEDLVASGVLTRTNTEQKPEESRFMMINRIVVDDTMDSLDQALKGIREYSQRQELAKELFSLR